MVQYGHLHGHILNFVVYKYVQFNSTKLCGSDASQPCYLDRPEAQVPSHSIDEIFYIKSSVLLLTGTKILLLLSSHNFPPYLVMASINSDSRPVSESDSSSSSRIQTSKSDPNDNSSGKLSLLDHSYQVNRVGAPALPHLPLRTSNMDQSSELYRKYLNKEVQHEIETILS